MADLRATRGRHGRLVLTKYNNFLQILALRELETKRVFVLFFLFFFFFFYFLLFFFSQLLKIAFTPLSIVPKTFFGRSPVPWAARPTCGRHG